jgi:alanyl-tRNA synthetase
MFNLHPPERLPATVKLFHSEPYRQECDATVLYVQDDLVVTDTTVFYAESGGQVSDKGWIDDVEVVDVQKGLGTPIFIKPSDNPYGIDVPMVNIGTVIVHKLAAPHPFRVGQVVHMRLDWPLRYLHMRNHSASHFLFQAVKTVFGTDGNGPPTKGCYIYSKGSRFDYMTKFDTTKMPEVREVANALIAEKRDIIMEPDLRTNEVSYWRYGSIVIPCGGTHVRNASEVGAIRVKRETQGRALDRVYAYLMEG